MLSPVRHSLGMFEAGRVQDLGLHVPPFDESATPAVPGESSVKVPGPHNSLQVQKFHWVPAESAARKVLVKRAWLSWPNSASSRAGNCWRKRLSYALYQSPFSAPERTVAKYAHRSFALSGWELTIIPAYKQKDLAQVNKSGTGLRLLGFIGLVSSPSAALWSSNSKLSSVSSAIST